MMDMMFMNGAESSAIPSVLEAYQWLKNAREKINEKDFNEKLEKTKETFYAFMGGIGNDQIARSNQIAVGKNDKVGLVDGIYQYKADQNPKQKFSFESAWGDILDFFKNLINPESPISSEFGQAGRFALGEIIKPDPEIFSKNHKDLIEAYQTGAEGVDISQELKNKAEAGGYLKEILKMYRAGETDRKIDKDMEKYKALLEKDFEYIRDMMFECGAGESKDTEIQGIYQYFNNPGNKGKEIPQEMKDAFYGYLRGVDDDQKADAYEAVTGIKLEGLKNKVKLPDGSYSKTEETIIQEGPYAGWKVTAGFNDITTTTYFGHTGYDLGGEGKKDIYPILPGKVVAIETKPDKTGNGIIVVVEHRTPDDKIFYSAYSHLSAIEDVDNILGKEVGTETLIGQRGNTGIGNKSYHLHLSVFTGPPDDKLIKNPAGYASGDKKTTFEDTAGCIYNKYYCITLLRANGYWKNYTYYDPYLVMQTYGGIIDLYPRPEKT